MDLRRYRRELEKISPTYKEKSGQLESGKPVENLLIKIFIVENYGIKKINVEKKSNF
jgi:hypothetical protein